MAKVYYVDCPECKKEYYIDRILLEQGVEKIYMKCPYCKTKFSKPKAEMLKEDA